MNILVALLSGCISSENSTPFCPSVDEFGVPDRTCQEMKAQNNQKKATSTQKAEKETPKTNQPKDEFIFCPSVDEFGIRDPNCVK